MEQGQPRIWTLLSNKLGDNAQVEKVMEALRWPIERRRLVFKDAWQLGKPRFSPSLHHVDLEASDSLEAPWPDWIITVGRRPAMVAQWVRRQSGGKTRVILFGRPKRRLQDYALVVSPSQYFLPRRDNVLAIDLPLMRVDPEKLEIGRREWEKELADLPRPLTVVLVGGPTKPFAMPPSWTRTWIQSIRDLVQKSGGSLWVTTSRRTPPAVVEALRESLGDQGTLHVFDPGGGPNPYFGLLAWGDQFLVTGDSVSMLVEVASLNKPLVICELPERGDLSSRLHEALLRFCHRPGAVLRPLATLLQALGWMGYPRDLRAIHEALYRRGAAGSSGRGFLPTSAMIGDEVDVVCQRIRDLVEGNKASPEGPGCVAVQKRNAQ